MPIIDWENYGLLALNSTYYAKQNYNMAICLQDEEGTVIFENYTAEQDAYVFEIPIAGYMEYDEETQKEIYRDYTVKCAIDLNFPAEDSFKRTAETVDLLWKLRQINIVVCILSAVGVCFFFTCAILYEVPVIRQKKMKFVCAGKINYRWMDIG